MTSISDKASFNSRSKIEGLKQKLQRMELSQPKDTPNQRPKHIEDPHTRSLSSPTHQHLDIEIRYHNALQSTQQTFEQQRRIIASLDSDIHLLSEQAKLLKRDIDRAKDTSEEKLSWVERDIAADINEQLEEIKTIRRELIDSMDKKYKTIKSETMAVLGNEFQNGWEEARQEIGQAMNELRAKMESDQAARDQTVNFVVGSFGEEILKLEQNVQREREDRIQAHSRLQSVLSSMEEDVTNLLLAEKKECNAGLSSLQGYLQQLCYKIEAHLLR